MTQKPKVYFTKTITPSRLVDIFNHLHKELPSPLAIKIHSGEDGNQNFIRPEFFQEIVSYTKGRIVETNTSGDGPRSTTEKHKELISKHKWTPLYDVDLLDSDQPDIELETNGPKLKKNLVGSKIKDYKSMLVIAHFKGHQMGGYGGALKQLAIGCASSSGKSRIHSGGVCDDRIECWKKIAEQDTFLECMAEAACSIVKLFNGNMAFINVMKNISIDCDCNGKAEPPCMMDVGICGSVDPVACDCACLDIIKKCDDNGKEKFLERVNSKHGTHTIDVACEMGVGMKEYELVDID